ncbi:MAG: uracil-DNA glycosylase [Candidatus Gastranaerophilales bacterium]|nr:uracil-DNA glycosylase [Candidatus Gastranaerophilales bacterium]
MLTDINTDNLTPKKKVKILNEVKEICSQCKACGLHKTRTNVVFSDGNPSAKLMIIGEAPGKNEDERGLPFVGRSGQLLERLLANEGITRANDVYICNTVKCRPPENRVPTNEEKELCKGYLDAQISLIKPEIILLCGATAVQSMLDVKKGITSIRGEFFDGPFGAKMMPIFHPAYLLRYQSDKEGSPMRLMKDDIKKVKEFLSR